MEPDNNYQQMNGGGDSMDIGINGRNDDDNGLNGTARRKESFENMDGGDILDVTMVNANKKIARQTLFGGETDFGFIEVGFYFKKQL